MEFGSLRKTVVSRVLKVLLVFATIAIVAVTIQEWNSGNRIRILLVYWPVLAMILLVNYAKFISEGLKASAVIVIFTAVAFSELFSFGLASLTYMFFLISVTLTGVIFGIKAGYTALFASIVPIALAAAAYVSGKIPVSNDQQLTSLYWGGWITSTLAYVVGAGTLMATVTLLVGDLDKYSSVLEEVLARRNEDITRAVEDVSRNSTLASMQTAFPKLFHKLNTPLGNALVAVSYLRDNKDLNEESLKLVEIANRSLEEVRGEIKKLRILSLTLSDSGKSNSEDICTFLRDNTDLLTEGTSIRLDMKFEMESCLMNLDFLALVEVLKILIQNAEDHGNSAAPAVTVHVAYDNDKNLTVRVTDCGPGIQKPDRPLVFEPFFTKSGLHKMGLGLTIARNITENRLGGTLELLKSDMNGTCFAVQIPGEPS